MKKWVVTCDFICTLTTRASDYLRPTLSNEERLRRSSCLVLTSLRLWSSGSLLSLIVPSLISLSTTLQPMPRYLAMSPRLIMVSGVGESGFFEVGMALVVIGRSYDSDLLWLIQWVR